MSQLVTRPIEDFFPLVRPHATACPVPMVEQNIRLSAVEFCERTRCWRMMIRRPLIRAHQAMVAPIFAVIHEIEEASWNNCPLTPTQYSDVIDTIENPIEMIGTPRYITQDTPGSVTVIPFAEGMLRLAVFLKPKAADDLAADSSYDAGDGDINVLPEFLLTQFGEIIAAGALTRILSLPNQTYTDPKRAAGFLAQFERGANAHFGHNIKGQHRAPPRSRPDYF